MPEKMFPDTLKRVRKANCLSQMQLASKIGVSFMTMRRYETGESFPNKTTLGLILFTLHDKSIATAWANDYKILNPDTADASKSIEDIADMLYYSDDITLRNVIINIGQNEPIEFIKPYLDITCILLRLNDKGLTAVYDFAKLMTQIPDHQR